MGLYGAQILKSNGREIRFEVINEREIIDKQKEDISTYHNAVKDICDRLNEEKKGHKITEGTEDISTLITHRIIHKKGTVVKFNPVRLQENDALEKILIFVHEEYAIHYVHEIMRNTVRKYNNLNELVIRTFY